MNTIHLLKTAYSGLKKYAAEKDNFFTKMYKKCCIFVLKNKTTTIDYISIDIDPEFHILCL